MRLDDLVSSPARPGFQILAERPFEVTLGAIGKVWKLDIPFVHVADAEAFLDFAEPHFVKVAWALRVRPLGQRDSRIEIEVRVDATDEDSWRAFQRYFRIIGPGSHFIRRSALASVAKQLGVPEALENDRPLAGDELLPDAAGQLTHSITMATTPDRIWPWLVQMGCHRAVYYSVDVLDNAGIRSARELHPELANIAVGDLFPAAPDDPAGFEVLRVEAPHSLILGGLWDVEAGVQRRFAESRPGRYWHVTWSFVLEPLDGTTTRLHVRARAAFSPDQRLHAAWIRPVHHFMERAQLRNLAARVEGRLAPDDWRDILAGLGGAGLMLVNLLTPFRREARSHWGLEPSLAERSYPGDELIPEPRWSWTHGVEIEASSDEVWGWVAQIGADRGGFYSYQWLENVAGCGVRNAERVHPEWEVKLGDGLLLHPKMPALPVVMLERGRHFVAFGAPPDEARDSGTPWMAGSWLFFIEPLAPGRCRLVSRYRSDCSPDLATRLTSGHTLVEPIGFAMDRRMLLEIKSRAESGLARRRALQPGRS